MVTIDPLIVNSQNRNVTLQLGEYLGQLLAPQHIICLDGELGAGKTTFVRGVGHGWGTSDRVTSPTFTVMNIYQRSTDRQKLYHVDAYRLETPSAVESIGFDDIFAARGPVVIEWPELIRAILPPDYLWVHLEALADDEQRRLTFVGVGELHQALLQRFKERIVAE